MDPRKSTLLMPMLLVFVGLNAFFILSNGQLQRWHMDQGVLIVGNLLLFTVTISSFLMSLKGIRSANPHAFVRAVYASFLVKFFIYAIAAFVYIQLTKKNVNKPALFTCMGLYVVYTALEIRALSRLLKQKKNA